MIWKEERKTFSIVSEAFTASAFAYVGVDGGTAGMALVARLNDYPAVTVGGIEVGVGGSHYA